MVKPGASKAGIKALVAGSSNIMTVHAILHVGVCHKKKIHILTAVVKESLLNEAEAAAAAAAAEAKDDAKECPDMFGAAVEDQDQENGEEEPEENDPVDEEANEDADES